MRDLYADITARILSHLEAGAAPWSQPWSQPWSARASAAMPANAVTSRPYSGCNVVLLWMTQQERAYPSSRWMTFKQALEAGGNVRKGEKGSTVYFVSTVEREGEGDAVRRIPFLKSFTVFNVAQCDGVQADLFEAKPRAINPDARDDLAEGFLTATGARIFHGEGRAYYRRSTDHIMLPNFEAFKSAHAYYNVAFHELGHWTGAQARLDRNMGTRFGDHAYAAEELVAELCAAFLCAEFAFDANAGDHASYLDGFIKLLKHDARAFVTAASKASAAAVYLRDRANAAPALAA